jgi:methionine aminopeptidase
MTGGSFCGIAAIRPGGTTGDIRAAIQTFVEAQHMNVVRDFCGHGLGALFHDEPNIVHVGAPRRGDGVQAWHVIRRGATTTSSSARKAHGRALYRRHRAKVAWW